MRFVLKMAGWLAAYITAVFGALVICAALAMVAMGDYSASTLGVGVIGVSALVTAVRTRHARVAR